MLELEYIYKVYMYIKLNIIYQIKYISYLIIEYNTIQTRKIGIELNEQILCESVNVFPLTISSKFENKMAEHEK